MRTNLAICSLAALLVLAGCRGSEPDDHAATPARPAGGSDIRSDVSSRLAKYTTVALTADLGGLSDDQRRMIPLLIDASRLMDDLFWIQAYGDKDKLLASAADDAMRQLLTINYGPWDRLDGNAPFLPGVGPKPPGANFYPAGMAKEDFESAAAAAPDKGAALRSLYTLVRPDGSGGLKAVPFATAFAEKLAQAAELLRRAAARAPDPGLKEYLELRARALTTDDYRPSDLAWMDMKDNTIDVVIGPIETYEDQLYGYKASYEGYVLIKDKEWSKKLSRYARLLPELQRGLPVPAPYKKEVPGSDSDLNAYDVVYYAGDCNAGAKTIAINLPNDEQVQLEKGTRRLQLKNTMKAKFDRILVPIAEQVIDKDQRGHVTFDAFFANTMFHEVAHGLGVKNTINGGGTVRQALKERASALEEGKADVLGLYMVTKLSEKGELGDADVRDNFVTFLASIFRSIRFGASDAHGRANLARFNFFAERGAFEKNTDGTYRVDFDKMRTAMNALSGKILRFQGDGDYEGVGAFMDKMAVIGPDLQDNLDRLSEAGIPVDIVFDQGMSVLK